MRHVVGRDKPLYLPWRKRTAYKETMSEKRGTVRHMTQHTSFAGVFWQMTNRVLGEKSAHVFGSHLEELARGSTLSWHMRIVCQEDRKNPRTAGDRGFFDEFSHEKDPAIGSSPRSIKFQRRKHVNLLYAFKVMPYSAENRREKPLCSFRSAILD